MIPCVAGAEIVILEDDEYGEGEGSSRSAEATAPAIPPATPGPSGPPTRVLWSDVMADVALHGHVAPVYVEPDYAWEALEPWELWDEPCSRAPSPVTGYVSS